MSSTLVNYYTIKQNLIKTSLCRVCINVRENIPIQTVCKTCDSYVCMNCLKKYDPTFLQTLKSSLYNPIIQQYSKIFIEEKDKIFSETDVCCTYTCLIGYYLKVTKYSTVESNAKINFTGGISFSRFVSSKNFESDHVEFRDICGKRHKWHIATSHKFIRNCTNKYLLNDIVKIIVLYGDVFEHNWFNKIKRSDVLSIIQM